MDKLTYFIKYYLKLKDNEYKINKIIKYNESIKKYEKLILIDINFNNYPYYKVQNKRLLLLRYIQVLGLKLKYENNRNKQLNLKYELENEYKIIN